jgi:peptidoglycan L-alanyl-D-glutamate endopeptidase CwlK
VAANLDLLIPEFKSKVLQLLDRCRALGCEMRPYVTVRDPYEQARLWRQSRSTEEINEKVGEFEAAGADFLAECIRSVGPQHGDPVTNAPPGFSWHQWGEAVDCFWFLDGKAEWSAKRLVNGKNGYHVYANEAEALGFTAGGLWTGLKDWPHAQLRSAGSPLGAMTLAEMDAAMKQRFGG